MSDDKKPDAPKEPVPAEPTPIEPAPVVEPALVEPTPAEPATAKPSRGKSARAAGVTTRDTAALRGAAEAPAAGTQRRIVVSEGTRADLVRLRKVTDPATGYELRVGAGGKVTAYDRATGEPAGIPVVCPPIP